MLQASLFEGVAFDPFSFQEDGSASAEIDVGRGQVLGELDFSHAPWGATMS